jgi:hypothetical protein
LKNVSATRGARSVSEFTRSVACSSTNGNGAEKLEDALRTLNEHMAHIDHQLQALTEALKTATNSTKEEQGK